LHLSAEGLEHFALFGHVHPLEHVQISWVHRKEPHEFLKPLGHGGVQRRKLFQMLANPAALLSALSQQPFRHHIGHVLARDAYLLKPVLYPSYRIGHKLEPRTVEQRLLNARHEAKARQAAGLAQLPQKGQIQHQRLVLPRAQVFEHLVHHQQQSLVGVALVKGAHHGHQQVLAVGGLAHAREPVGDAHSL